MEILFKDFIKDKFITALSGKGLAPKLENTNTEDTTKELITFGIYDELSYNSRNDIDIVVKRLTGSIESGLASVPFQIMIMVKQQYYDACSSALESMVIDCNEKHFNVLTSGGTYKNTFVVMSTPTVLQANTDIGLDKYTLITINSTIMYAQTSMLKLKDNQIKIDSVAVDVLQSGIGWVAQQHSNGMMATSGRMKQSNYCAVTTFTFTMIAVNNAKLETIMSRCINNNDINVKYVLSFTIGTTNYSKSCIATSFNFGDTINGYPSVTVTFMVGE